MFLEEMSEPKTIVEAEKDYARKLYFDYQKKERGRDVLSSPSPIVLYLGTWRMTDKQGNKKKFICGVNLAYLADEEELAAIQQALPDILRSKNMKSRYRIGKTLLPDIFRRAYRTYNINNLVTRPIRGRLYALKTTDDDKDEARSLADKDGLDWEDLGNQERNQYLDKAVQKRGSEDVKRQEKSKKERDQIDRHFEKEPEEEKPEAPLEKEPEEAPREPPKPAPAPTAPVVKPPKREFKPIELGPGYEVPTPEEEPELQSPIKNVQSQMAQPKKIKVHKPEPNVIHQHDEEPDENRLQ